MASTNECFEMDSEDLSELIEHLETYLQALDEIYKSEGKILKSQHDTIFRILHSLKGACGMFGMQKCVQTLHDLEEKWCSLEDVSLLSLGIISYFSKAGDYMLSAFLDGDFEPHCEALKECWQCLEEKNFSEACVPNPVYSNVSGHESNRLILITPVQELEIVKVAEEEKVSLTVYDCPNKAYQMSKEIREAKMILVSDKFERISPLSFIKIINIVNPKCIVGLLRSKSISNREANPLEESTVFLSIGRNLRTFREHIRTYLNTFL